MFASKTKLNHTFKFTFVRTKTVSETGKAGEDFINLNSSVSTLTGYGVANRGSILGRGMNCSVHYQV
jgi:hypothetical protein